MSWVQLCNGRPWVNSWWLAGAWHGQTLLQVLNGGMCKTFFLAHQMGGKGEGLALKLSAVKHQKVVPLLVTLYIANFCNFKVSLLMRSLDFFFFLSSLTNFLESFQATFKTEVHYLVLGRELFVVLMENLSSRTALIHSVSGISLLLLLRGCF